jgi:hypothetical protein
VTLKANLLDPLKSLLDGQSIARQREADAKQLEEARLEQAQKVEEAKLVIRNQLELARKEANGGFPIIDPTPECAISARSQAEASVPLTETSQAAKALREEQGVKADKLCLEHIIKYIIVPAKLDWDNASPAGQSVCVDRATEATVNGVSENTFNPTASSLFFTKVYGKGAAPFYGNLRMCLVQYHK